MRGKPHADPARAQGFSLIEVLVVVGVVALLATLAYPAYQDQVMKARRSTAKSALADAGSRQEQFFLNNKTYTTTVGAGGLNLATTTDGGFYTLSVDAATGACPIDRCWRMRAAPEPAQADDRCGTLTISSDGARTPAECWP